MGIAPRTVGLEPPLQHRAGNVDPSPERSRRALGASVERMSTISPPPRSAARASSGGQPVDLSPRPRQEARRESFATSVMRASLRSRGAITSRPARAAAAAVLRRLSCAASRLRGTADVVDLGRGNPEVGPPRTSSRRFEPPPPGRTSTATRRSAGCRGCARRSPPATARCTASSSTPSARSRSSRARRRRSSSLRCALAQRGDTILLPDPVLPRLPVGRRARRRRDRAAAARPRRRFGARPRGCAAAAAVFLNYPSNPCAVCAPPGTVRGGGRVRRAAPAPPSSTTPPTSTSSSTAARPQSFLATPGAKEVGVELWSMSKTYGMAGWRIGFVVGNAEIVERVNHAERPFARRHLRPAAGGGDRRARRAAGLRRGAARDLRATARPARGRAARAAGVRRARSTSGCGCPKG